MSYPNGTYIAQISDPAVRAEVEQLYALFQGYLSTQHKDDGSHGGVTADSLAVTGNVTVGGNGTFTGSVTAGGPSNARVSLGTLDENITLTREIPLDNAGGVASFAITQRFGSGSLSWAWQQANRTVLTSEVDFTLGYGVKVLTFRRTSSSGAGTFSIFVPFSSSASATPTVNLTITGALTAGTYAGGETGTWTPVLSFGGGSTGITYGTRTGTYSKFGNVVTVEMRIVLTSKGSSTGAAAIAGLPYSANLNPSALLDFGAGGVGLSSTPYAAIAGTSLFPLHIAAGVRTQLTDANFSGTDDVRFGISYRV